MCGAGSVPVGGEEPSPLVDVEKPLVGANQVHLAGVGVMWV